MCQYAPHDTRMSVNVKVKSNIITKNLETTMSGKMDRLLSPREVGVILDKGRTTLYRMALAGELSPRKIRGRLGYLESEVQQYLTSLPVVGPKSCGTVADNPLSKEA
jgi:predicted DNA-binding transcriptional regulator AlpA